MTDARLLHLQNLAIENQEHESPLVAVLATALAEMIDEYERLEESTAYADEYEDI